MDVFVSFLVCSVCGKMRYMDKRAHFLVLWGWWQCIASLNGWDANPGNAPKGMSPRLGVCQRLFVCLLLHCLCSLRIFWKEMGGLVGFALFHMLSLAG